ncbi:MAG: hypothetical protein AB8G05_10175 [Oligoflexales bacterium]
MVNEIISYPRNNTINDLFVYQFQGLWFEFFSFCDPNVAEDTFFKVRLKKDGSLAVMAEMRDAERQQDLAKKSQNIDMTTSQQKRIKNLKKLDK